MKILVTGATGYIGSHTCLELLQAGYEVVAVDNLSNSKKEALRRVQELAGKSLEFHQVDMLDRESLSKVFDSTSIDAVIHFAGLKAVGESVAIPLSYYHNNVTGTITLCEVMSAHRVKILSSVHPPLSTGIRQSFQSKRIFPFLRQIPMAAPS